MLKRTLTLKGEGADSWWCAAAMGGGGYAIEWQVLVGLATACLEARVAGGWAAERRILQTPATE